MRRIKLLKMETIVHSSFMLSNPMNMNHSNCAVYTDIIHLITLISKIICCTLFLSSQNWNTGSTSDLKRQFSLISPSNIGSWAQTSLLYFSCDAFTLHWNIYHSYKRKESAFLRYHGAVFRHLPIWGTLDGNDLSALELDFSFLFEGLYSGSK